MRKRSSRRTRTGRRRTVRRITQSNRRTRTSEEDD